MSDIDLDLSALDALLEQHSAEDIETAADAELCERDLSYFYRQSWNTIDPDPYQHTWHVDALADHLHAVTDGEIRKLLINIPPRHGKTNIVSIAWQAWTWAQKKIGPRSGPQVSFLTLTYASKLALDNAVKARRMIASDWYQQRWGKHFQITKDMDSAERFGTTAGGIRFSIGFDGSTLGRGGIIQIIDDPIKIDDAESDTVREHVLTVFKESLQSRVTDPREAAQVIIMQRVHERDLSGFVLEQGGWEHLMLPGLYDPTRHCVTSIGWQDPRGTDPETKEQLDGLDDDGHVVPGSPMDEAQDTPLWADRWGREQLEALNLGPYAWAGQVQQMPAPRGGGIIHRDWWRPWRDAQFPAFGTVVASLDTALKEKETNDFNALTIWGAFAGDKGHAQFMLIDAWRGRCSLAALVETVARYCRKRKVDYLLIEDKTRGHDVAAELQRSIRGNSMSVRLLNPKGDKVSRCNSVAELWSGAYRIDPDTRIESYSGGIIWAPVGEGAEYDWVDPVISEFETFPQGKNDDWVDSGVQAISWLRTNGVALRKVEFDEEETMKTQYRKPRPAPYDV